MMMDAARRRPVERLERLINDARRNEPGRRGVKSDLLGLLRGEIVAAICRHVTLKPENVQVKMNRGATVSTLAINIEIPRECDDMVGSA